MTGRKRRPRKRGPRGVWSAEIRDRFLALLRESGNARATLRIVGHPNMFHKRRRRDPDFARDWAVAVAEADKRLGAAESPFVEGAEKAMGTNANARPPTADDLGGILKPRRKRPQTRPQPVIRRTSSGRVQITLAREGHVTAEIEADFVALLRATGNFNASARAIGFKPHSIYDRYNKWPAFARDCDEALKEASVRLDFQLFAHAHALLRRPADREEGDGADPEADDIPFDPQAAMRILGFLDRRREGRTTRGPRGGLTERSFAEARDSILRKIEAIEAHERMMKERKDGGPRMDEDL